MPHSKQSAVTPVCNVHIVRELLPASGRWAPEAYVPERDADAVKYFAAWMTPRGWMVFCCTFNVDMRSNPASLLGDFYAPKRIPDVQGSIHRNVWGTFETIAIHKIRGPYAPNPGDIRRIYRAILAD